MCNAINISYSHRFLILTRIHFKLTLLTLWNYSLVLFDKNLHSKKAKIVFITIWNHKIVFWLGLQIFFFNQISVKVWDLSSSSGSIPIRGYWTCKSTNSHRRKFSKLVTYYDHVLILRNSIIITRQAVYLLLTAHHLRHWKAGLSFTAVSALRHSYSHILTDSDYLKKSKRIWFYVDMLRWYGRQVGMKILQH